MSPEQRALDALSVGTAKGAVRSMSREALGLFVKWLAEHAAERSEEQKGREGPANGR